MEEITLGELIMNLRIKKNISRARLCDGICSTVALGRYESNERVPDKFLIDCILERLGENSARLEFISSEDEFSKSVYRRDIEEYLDNRQYSDVEKILEIYRSNTQKSERLHYQYIYFKEGEICFENKKYEDALDLYKKALDLTERLDVIDKGLCDKLLSDIETGLLYKAAETYKCMGETDCADYIFDELRKYLMEQEDDCKKKAEYLPLVVIHTAETEINRSNYGLAKQYLNMAEELLIKEYHLTGLEKVLELKRRLDEDNDEEELHRLLAIKILNTRNVDGTISDEGIKLWESTIKQI